MRRPREIPADCMDSVNLNAQGFYKFLWQIKAILVSVNETLHLSLSTFKMLYNIFSLLSKILSWCDLLRNC